MEELDVCLCLLPIHGLEKDGYVCCSCGDLVLILTVKGADYKNGAGVYARNLRTKRKGWLTNYDDLHFKVVGCRGDIYPDLQDERPSALVPARAPAPYSMGPADLTNSVMELGTTAERLVDTATCVAEAGIPSVHAKRSAPCDIVRCNHCISTGHSCYSNEDSECFSWCLQAKGWHCKKNKWRCPNCHDQLRNCQERDLGPKCMCNEHGVLQHPPELGNYHFLIETSLDVNVTQMIEFGFTYRWHHIQCTGSYPASSPTDWCFGSESSRVWSSCAGQIRFNDFI